MAEGSVQGQPGRRSVGGRAASTRGRRATSHPHTCSDGDEGDESGRDAVILLWWGILFLTRWWGVLMGIFIKQAGRLGSINASGRLHRIITVFPMAD